MKLQSSVCSCECALCGDDFTFVEGKTESSVTAAKSTRPLFAAMLCSSIYTAELQAVLFALEQAYQSQENRFMIFSDSLSSLQALENLKTDHPLLKQIQDTLHKIDVDQKEIVFMWVPGHVSIRGNEAADRAVKELLTRKLQTISCLFSDLKPFTAKYIHLVWQKEWHEAVIVSNKLRESLPKLSYKMILFC